MPRKLIGITCETTLKSGLESPRQALPRPYVWAIEKAGGIPVLLPATDSIENAERYLSILDGLLLSGGVDVDPALYGEEAHPELGRVDPDRDSIEIPLTRLALAQNMPIFAICRGIQVLNVAMGGTLYQDLPSENPSHLQHQQRHDGIARDVATHNVWVEEGTRLAEIVGEPCMATNSFHHQALKKVAEGLTVTAYAEDGIIEGVESTAYRYVLGVQFHPEETAFVDEKSMRLFQAFVDAL